MLNMSHIRARDIPDAWYQVLVHIYNYGKIIPIEKGSFEGGTIQRKQLDHMTLHITHPFSRPRLPEIPQHLSHIPPPTTAEYVHDYVSYIMSSSVSTNEQYTYGQRIFTPVQLEDGSASNALDSLIVALTDVHYSNQITLSIAQPTDIILTDPPCLRSISFRCIKDHRFSDKPRLHMFVHFRSWDCWAGLPANINGLLHLWEYVTQWTECELGEFVSTCEGAHVYSDVFRYVEDLVG